MYIHMSSLTLPSGVVEAYLDRLASAEQVSGVKNLIREAFSPILLSL